MVWWPDCHDPCAVAGVAPTARPDRGRALSAGESLRLLYRTALERFVLVALLFAVALGTLQLDPLALITGFIVGQLALVFTELIKTE